VSAAFTPGPWQVGGEWPQIVAIYDQRCVYLAHAETGIGAEWVDGNPLGREVAQANARLIAAAPELYAKVERAANIFRVYAELHRAKNTPEGDAKAASNEVIAEEMEAVLAKARGEVG
jgi:hypothetical protein